MKTERTKTKLNMRSVFVLFSLIATIGLTSMSCESNDPGPGSDPGTCDEFDPSSDCWPPEGLYLTQIFDDVSYTKDLLYSQESTPVQDKYSKRLSYTYDFYEAEDNLDPNRPLVMLSPGGGYSRYTQLDKLSEIAINLAKRGYAVAIVRYSIGTPNIDTYITSTQDQSTAIRYFKSKASELRIDAENIFIGGWSTGANLSMHNAFFTEEESGEIVNADFRNMIDDGLDRLGLYTDEYNNYTNDVKGVLVMMGYLFGDKIIDEGEPALMMINHQDATLSDEVTKIIGEFDTNTIEQFGTDVLYERAKAQNFSEDKNLEYVRLSHEVSEKFGANYASLSTEHCDDIAAFFHRNLD